MNRESPVISNGAFSYKIAALEALCADELSICLCVINIGLELCWLSCCCQLSCFEFADVKSNFVQLRCVHAETAEVYAFLSASDVAAASFALAAVRRKLVSSSFFCVSALFAVSVVIPRSITGI